MPLQATSGAASYDAFGGGVPVVPAYIEEVFSTWLYTGNGATGQSITNGIDLSTKGGLVWLKSRTAPSGSSDNNLYDTVRGASQLLISNSTAGNTTATRLSFQTTGFNLTNEASSTNESGVSYVSWTFREQPKFFDIQTWTGSGANRTISHSLGSVPACIIVKRTDTTGAWQVYHRSLANTQYLVLNTTAAVATGATRWNSTTPTSSVFSLGTDATVNASGGTYVAYIFAHDAGGFGLTGTDNVISCGSYTGNGSTTGPEINLGYEPQWLLIKNTTTSGYDWWMFDVMRGWTNTSSGDNTSRLTPDSSQAEDLDRVAIPTATGFRLVSSTTNYNGSGDTYIYIAIRRGPMKVPTSGTSVLDVETYTGTQTVRTITTANTVDLSFTKSRSTAGTRWNWTDRLRGATKTLDSSLTAAEASDTTGYTSFAVQQGYTLGTGDTYDVNTSGRTYVSWNLTRSPSVFDEVCYTGTGSARTINHNLGVAPELMIVRSRSAAANWEVYVAALGPTKYLRLDLTSAAGTYSDFWNDTAPTASVFTVATDADVNGSGRTQVAYLFATCAGVSKVGSYTGTGATQTISCGFTGGARFVLIKRTDSTGDWYVWDSARGIVSGNDPYLLLNSTAAEVTNTDYVDTYSAGFEISSTAPAAINASGGTFIFLAIA